jgi:MFS family permease
MSGAEPAAEPKQAVAKPGLLINRNFALLWYGQAVSQIGDWVFDTTLVIWIGTVLGRGQPWAPLAVSGVLLATALPYFCVGPIAGVFVDRWDKRRTMLAADGIRAGLILLLLALTALPFVRLPLGGILAAVYVTVFLASLCSQFFRPSLTALIGDLVAEPYRVRASGLSELTANLAFVIGPAFAGPLVFGIGVGWALLINAVSFAVSFAALFAIRPPAAAAPVEAPAGASHVVRELLSGLRFYFGNRVLTTLLVSFAIGTLGGGAFNALAIFFVTQNLHADPSLYGVAVAAVGLGAIAGAASGTYLGERFGVVRMFWLATLALGVSIVVLARFTSIGPGLVAYVVFGFTQGPINIAVTPLVLHVTPRELVGRAVAVLEPAIMAASILSLLLAGLLDSTVLHGFHAHLLDFAFGPVDTIYTAVGVLIFASGIYAMLGLRGIELTRPAEPVLGVEAQPPVGQLPNAAEVTTGD